MPKRYCPYCGMPMRVTINCNFCQKCGQSILRAPEPSTPVKSPIESDDHTEQASTAGVTTSVKYTKAPGLAHAQQVFPTKDESKPSPKKASSLGQRFTSWLIFFFIAYLFLRYSPLPLHYAIESGDPTLTRFLLDIGADPTATYKNNGTALHWAANRASFDDSANRLEIVNLLLARGMLVDIRDTSGDTPLHFTARCIDATSGGKSATTVMDILLTHGADINARNIKGQTPFAVFFCSTIMPDFLIPHDLQGPAYQIVGVKPPTSSESDLTPALQFFADHGADFNARNNEGKTPLGETLEPSRKFFHLTYLYQKNSIMVPTRWKNEMAFLISHGMGE